MDSSYWCRHSTKLSTPPSDVAAENRRRREANARATASDLSSKAKQPPYPNSPSRMCLLAICLGSEWALRDGWCTAVISPDSGCEGDCMAPASQEHIRVAARDCADARTCKVRSERSNSHVSSDPGVDPMAVRSWRSCSAASALGTTSA